MCVRVYGYKSDLERRPSRVKADGQMRQEENGFRRDTPVHHSALLLAPSISYVYPSGSSYGWGCDEVRSLLQRRESGGINNSGQGRGKRKTAGGRERSRRGEESENDGEVVTSQNSEATDQRYYKGLRVTEEARLLK